MVFIALRFRYMLYLPQKRKCIFRCMDEQRDDISFKVSFKLIHSMSWESEIKQWEETSPSFMQNATQFWPDCFHVSSKIVLDVRLYSVSFRQWSPHANKKDVRRRDEIPSRTWWFWLFLKIRFSSGKENLPKILALWNQLPQADFPIVFPVSS